MDGVPLPLSMLATTLWVAPLRAAMMCLSVNLTPVAVHQKQVNAAYVDPSYIAKVRKKLDLDQREAAAIFGHGSP